MDINTAKLIIGTQEKNLRKIKDIRLFNNGYEFRLNYEGGFGAFICIDYRKVGTRNFKYFSGIGAYDCIYCHTAINKCVEHIENKIKNY